MMSYDESFQANVDTITENPENRTPGPSGRSSSTTRRFSVQRKRCNCWNCWKGCNIPDTKCIDVWHIYTDLLGWFGRSI